MDFELREKLNTRLGQIEEENERLSMKINAYKMVEFITYECGKIRSIDKLVDKLLDIINGVSGIQYCCIYTKEPKIIREFNVSGEIFPFDVIKEYVERKYEEDFDKSNVFLLEDTGYIFGVRGSYLLCKLKYYNIDGFIVLYHRKRNFFNEVILGLYELLSIQISVFLSNIKQYEQLKEASYKDPLTGLKNRLRYNKDEECNVNSIVMIDIDHFKKYNDTYGHAGGDEILRKLGRVLNQYDDDKTFKIYRYGGEEFCIRASMSNEKTLKLCERIKEEIKTISLDDVNSDFITVSIGICHESDFIEFELTPYIMQELADNALYVSKEMGRDTITVATMDALKSKIKCLT